MLNQAVFKLDDGHMYAVSRDNDKITKAIHMYPRHSKVEISMDPETNFEFVDDTSLTRAA